jgi:hypothetical protein
MSISALSMYPESSVSTFAKTCCGVSSPSPSWWALSAARIVTADTRPVFGRGCFVIILFNLLFIRLVYI